MKWAKEQGAVGIFFRGMEGNLTLDNPYFFPIYDQAGRLDLPICIHTGSGSRHLMQLFDVERNHTFAHNRVLPVVAFRDLVANRIPEQFPNSALVSSKPRLAGYRTSFMCFGVQCAAI